MTWRLIHLSAYPTARREWSPNINRHPKGGRRQHRVQSLALAAVGFSLLAAPSDNSGRYGIAKGLGTVVLLFSLTRRSWDTDELAKANTTNDCRTNRVSIFLNGLIRYNCCCLKYYVITGFCEPIEGPCLKNRVYNHYTPMDLKSQPRRWKPYKQALLGLFIVHPAIKAQI